MSIWNDSMGPWYARGYFFAWAPIIVLGVLLYWGQKLLSGKALYIYCNILIGLIMVVVSGLVIWLIIWFVISFIRNLKTK